MEHDLHVPVKDCYAHCHPPDIDAIDVLKLRGDLKKRAQVDSAPPSRIMLDAGATVDSSIQVKLSRNAQAQIIKRVRDLSTADPKSLTDLQIPDSLRTTLDGGKFYRGYVETGNGDRAYIFAAKSDLRRMARAKHWSADGTFNVSPLLSQMLTIHCSIDPDHVMTVPAVYVLMSSKSEELYVTVLEQLTVVAEQHGITLEGPKIYVDYEKALINAFRSVFPDGVVCGCFFHFAQALWRKFGKVGLRKGVNKNLACRHFGLVKALAFLPVDAVADAFGELKKTAPPFMSEWMKYVEETWINGREIGQSGRRSKPLFPVPLWSVYDNVLKSDPRNNNRQESWHARLSRLVDIKNVSILRLICFLQKEQKDVQGRIQRSLSMHSSQVKPASKEKDDQLLTIVGKYRQYALMDYLETIAGKLSDY